MYWPFILIAICVLNPIQSRELYRLPKSIQPEHYKLNILTHLDEEHNYTFYGKVYITVLCTEDTPNITLHTKNLNLNTTAITIHELDGTTEKSLIPVTDTEFDLIHEFFIITTKDSLKKGQRYILFIPFEAELNDGLLGYYRSSYFDLATQKSIWLSVTQFEATYARRAFPCFDEPEMKAKFLISLSHHKKYTALSNMPIKSTEQLESHPDFVCDHFEETVPMSTYLVAYSINDFEYRESMVKLTDDVVFRIWARRDAIEQVEYARYIGPKVLKFYEKYFDVKFPLPKMDMIAIPDFSAGAMENWGLITYRETALLYQPNVSSSTSQARVASVVAHELAHQWFGNLVTMKWWTDLWLNEGFATYVASLGVHYLHPEWNSFDEESVDNTLDIFKFDALKSSHPVSITIGDPSEISQIFDKISYEKGSSIIRMMHLFLGEEVFQLGVSNYLKKHAYGNAEQDNLWESLTIEAHKHEALPKSLTVKQIMDVWTLQTGYPIVNVKRDYEKGCATVNQKRFLLDSTKTREELEKCWWVPLSYTSKHELDFNTTEPREWMKCDEHDQAIETELDDLPDDDEWILMNIQMAGLYKVKYDEKNWNLLIEQLVGSNFQDIHPISRAQLIDDALDLAWSGDEDYSIALRLVEYLRQEHEYIPWKSALVNLNAVNRMLQRTPKYGLFKEFMKRVLTNVYRTIGGLNTDRSETDRLDTIKHKVQIVSWACRFNVGDCEEKSKKLFKKWMGYENPDINNPIPVDLRYVVYCTAIRKGNEVEWNFLWQRYNKSNVGSEQIMILQSLGCTREIWLLQRYLEWTLDESSGVRKQDSSIVFTSVARGDVGYYLAKSYFIDHINDFYEYLQPGVSRLARYVNSIADRMILPSEYEQFKSFVDHKAKSFEKSSQSVRQALETIAINIQWQEKNLENIGKFLSNYDITINNNEN